MDWRLRNMVKLYEKYEAVRKFPLLRAYLENFENTSMENHIPGLLSFFFIQGQVSVPYVRLPTGDSHLDLRVHVFWIQPSRSGKSISWNFIGDILKDINIPATMYASGTDAGLAGSIIEIKGEKGEPPTTEVIDGLLSGRKCINFDEGSIILMPGKHSQETVLYLQSACNPIGTENNKIVKHMKNGIVENESLVSLWITTFPPKGVKEYVLTKGIFQRVLLYWGEWDMDKRQSVSTLRLNTFGKKPQKVSMSKADIIEYFKELDKRLRDRVLTLSDTKFIEWDSMTREEQEEKVQEIWWECFTYGDDFRIALQQAKDDYFELVKIMDPSLSEVVASFLPGIENYLGIFSTHIAMLDESWEVKPEYVDMAHEILYDLFTNLISWLEDEVEVGMKEAQKTHYKERWIKAYNECSEFDLGDRGPEWRRITTVKKRYIASTGVSLATATRHFKDYGLVMFKSTSAGSIKYIRLKGEKGVESS
jgi:hypothetical protein